MKPPAGGPASSPERASRSSQNSAQTRSGLAPGPHGLEARATNCISEGFSWHGLPAHARGEAPPCACRVLTVHASLETTLSLARGYRLAPFQGAKIVRPFFMHDVNEIKLHCPVTMISARH